MLAAELAETALSMKNISSDAEDTWTTFEVIENGELGRQEASRPGSALNSFEYQKYFIDPEGNYVFPLFLHAAVNSMQKAVGSSFLC